MPLPSGRALLDPEAILRVARLSPGQRYADFGAGTLGHFVFAAVNLVGDATPVYAVDILPSVLDAIRSRALAEGASSVIPVWADVEKVGAVDIAPQSLDLISFVHMEHLIKKTPAMLEEAKRLLKEKGKVLLVGWEKDVATPIAPAQEDRVSAEEMQELVEAAGMVVMQVFDAGSGHWGVLVRREPFKDYPIKIIG